MTYLSSFGKVISRAVMLLTLVAFSGTALAIETTSGIKGVVTDDSGSPVGGASVTITSGDTGLTRSAQSNPDGSFAIRNLPVGGNYTVTARGAGYSGSKVEGVYLVLGETTDLNFRLSSTGTMEEVVVTGSMISSQVAVGPSASFNLRTLETAPAINRNINDVLRIDPRVYVDESRGGINAIQCGGKNSRFNSLTVDGVRMNDLFGLNANGYPTERQPFPYDAIEQVAIEMAPFDVKYGSFEACNINAVTKSGTNEFHGSVFYDYTNDNWRADSLEGDAINTGAYDEKRFGFEVGGPIIEDQLFFHVSYEKLEGANLFDRGPIGSGAVNEVRITQAELDEIVSIANSLYLYDPGAIPSSRDNEDEKVQLKLDWYVTDAHRASFTYNWNDGNNFTQSDGDLDEFEFENHLYERGAELESYVVSLFSDWTERFSTEVRVSTIELDNRQISVGGTDFGEIRIETDDVDVYIGGDDSRQSNKLDYEVFSLSFRGTYDLDNGHSISFGIEHESLDIYNLFVQHTETEIRFDGIDNFRNGFADAIYYNNAPSNNPVDAAADWGYDFNTAFIQDEFDLVDNMTVVVGLRYDWYSTDDSPVVNADFVTDYGFANNATVDGEGLLQPRIGVTYDISDAMTLRGGVGLYTGGNPNVWLSNTYSANNVLQFGQRGRSFGYTDGSRSLFDADVVYEAVESTAPAGAGPGYGVPKELFDAVAGGTGDNFEINYLDPDFDLPSEWKMNLGLSYIFESGLQVDADLLWTQGRDTAMIKRGDLERVGDARDGYPDYDSVREPSFVLTNSDVGNRSAGVSIMLSQEYDNGWNWSAGYNYNDAEEIQPMTSSVAFSNYTNRAFFDPQEDVRATSVYNIRHRFTFLVDWEGNLIGDQTTRVSMFATARQGPPYSNTFNGTIDPYGFTPFLDFAENVLEPGVRRNDNEGSWWFKADLRVEHMWNLPTGRASVYMNIDNLTNLINDDWGILDEVDFPNTVGPGDVAEPRVGDASRYEVRVGVRYEF